MLNRVFPKIKYILLTKNSLSKPAGRSSVPSPIPCRDFPAEIIQANADLDKLQSFNLSVHQSVNPGQHSCLGLELDSMTRLGLELDSMTRDANKRD